MRASLSAEKREKGGKGGRYPFPQNGGCLGSLPRRIPCARLIMLGVDLRYQGEILGSRLMKQALAITQAASAQLGCYGLYLDADPAAIGFYQKLGFALLEGDQSPAPSPMFITLQSISSMMKKV